jgi:flagellar basal-body rod modification protein FlgD
MQIPGISASDTLASTNPFQSPELGRDAFMQLLVTQLENQDPLEPIQNEAFVAQLASFSSLEQLETLNDSVIAMIALNQSNALFAQMTQSSALIGKQVTWIDAQTGESTTGTVESVKVVDGLAVLNVDGQDVPLANVTEVLAGEPPAGDDGADGSAD